MTSAYSCKSDADFLRLLALAPFVRRSRGWRFGTKAISDRVVDRLVDAGVAEMRGDQLVAIVHD